MITGGHLIHVSVSARKDKSLLGNGAMAPCFTTDLVFSRSKVRLSDDERPRLTSTPPMTRSSAVTVERRYGEKDGWPFVCQKEAR